MLKIPSGRIFNKIHYDFNFPHEALANTSIVRDAIRHRVVSKESEVGFGYLVRRIIESRHCVYLSGELPEPQTTQRIQQLNDKVLTLRVLADLFNVLPPTIGRRLKDALQAEVTHGR